jgi:4-amino-4-deoxy-L-arabinose transferase-like glycosyltransferase
VICLTRPLLCAIVVGLGAIGFLGILLCTPLGIGIYSDSLVYVGAARNLLLGQGLIYFDNNGQMAPVTHYAPLYPLVIAGVGLTGIDPLEGARWVNALLFAFNIILAGSTVFASTLSFTASVSASLLVLSAFPMVQIHSTALTEPLCLFLGFWGLHLLTLYLNESKQSLLYLSALSIGLSCLTRYAGMVFVLTGATALLWLGASSWKSKLARASLFCALSVLPLSTWLIRNSLSAGNAVNRTFAVHLPGTKDLSTALDALCLWFFPVTLLGETGWTRLIILLVIVGVLWWSAKKMVLLRSRLHQICALFLSAHVAFVIASRSLLDEAIQFDTRMLAPAYLAAMIIIVSAIAIWRESTMPKMAAVLRRIFVYLIFTLSALQTMPAIEWLKHSYTSGIGLAEKGWRESQLMRILGDLNGTTPVYTNAPDLIYIFFNRLTRMIPRKVDPYSRLPNDKYEIEVAELKTTLRENSGVVVYFKAPGREWFLPSLKELETPTGLRLIGQGRDVAIYNNK